MGIIMFWNWYIFLLHWLLPYPKGYTMICQNQSENVWNWDWTNTAIPPLLHFPAQTKWLMHLWWQTNSLFRSTRFFCLTPPSPFLLPPPPTQVFMLPFPPSPHIPLHTQNVDQFHILWTREKWAGCWVLRWIDRTIMFISLFMGVGCGGYSGMNGGGKRFNMI